MYIISTRYNKPQSALYTGLYHSCPLDITHADTDLNNCDSKISKHYIEAAGKRFQKYKK